MSTDPLDRYQSMMHDTHAPGPPARPGARAGARPAGCRQGRIDRSGKLRHPYGQRNLHAAAERSHPGHARCPQLPCSP